MDDLPITVTGATGRMGQAVVRALETKPGVCLCAAVGRDAPEAAFARAGAIIDFTQPAALEFYATLAAQAGAAFVCGTTGLDAEHHQALQRAARHVPVVYSENMSLGINVLSTLVHQAAKALADFDIEIAEVHHNQKVDAPSGTALLLGRAAAAGRAVAHDDVALLSRASGPRESGSIGYATSRGGTVAGEHTVMLLGSHERLELVHRASDRTIFAQGAVQAALWAVQQEAGLYDMQDVLGLR